MLLVNCVSSDPFSTTIVDPRTGVSTWSYKGSELQGGKTGIVRPLGNSGDHVMIAIHDRPLIHALAIHNRDKFHAKCVISGTPSAMATSSCGSLLFVAIKTQVFTWLLTTGELLSVVDAHYQSISRLALSHDDAMLCTASEDGAVHAYLVSDLCSLERDVEVRAVREWRAHSLACRGMCVSGGSNPRVASVGLDHVAMVHSVSLDACLLKISADRPLTACALDRAETRLFIGTDDGSIVQINLYDMAEQGELLVQSSDKGNARVPVFSGHEHEITSLAVNSDGTMLASGDASGKYCVWDVASRQCIKVSSMRGAISGMEFVPSWPSLTAADHAAPCRPNMQLQRGTATGKTIAVLRHEVQEKAETQAYWRKQTDELVDRLMFEIECGSSADPKSAASTKRGKGEKRRKLDKDEREEEAVENGDESVLVIEDDDVIIEESASSQNGSAGGGGGDGGSSKADKARIKKLEKEIGKLKRINEQLYQFAAKEIIDKE